MAWGLLREYEVYEDTQKTLDDHLGAGRTAPSLVS
jgi:hypothetical protein